MSGSAATDGCNFTKLGRIDMQSTKTSAAEQPARIARNFDSIDEFLSANGIKPTRQRIAIATHIFEKEQHLSAEIILERVNKDSRTTSVSKATVYNTLNLFVKNGILQEVALDTQKILFDTNTDHHHHIFNLDNGDVRDIQPVEIDLFEVGGIQQGENVSCVDLVITLKNHKE